MRKRGSNLHSDERATPGLALGIATGSRGSDHLRSRPAIDLYHLPEKVLRKIYGTPVKYDGPLSSEHTEYVGKAWMVFWQEMCYMGVDCLGICKYHTMFLGATLPNFEDWPKVLYYNTGLTRMVMAKTHNGDLALAYLPDNAQIQVDMSAFPAAMAAKWFDPMTGKYEAVSGAIPTERPHTFVRPSGWEDAVLVLTDPTT